ncbi:hypothetical protein KAJ61_00885 [Candidatus Parcubacteria bacterium]|nr:hypothetical protein [Candidatus Parcubacteria bacterium]
MDIILIFKTIRDTPYKIPLSLKEKDNCCYGKHKRLKNLLIKQGLNVRYRVCSFLWSSLDLPKKILDIPHNDYGVHPYLEVLINNKWVIVDATWDIGLKNVFYINEWDGKSDTEIAVKPIKIFTLRKSKDIMNGKNDKEISSDSEIDLEFCKVFNSWLKENRKIISHNRPGMNAMANLIIF